MSPLHCTCFYIFLLHYSPFLIRSTTFFINGWSRNNIFRSCISYDVIFIGVLLFTTLFIRHPLWTALYMEPVINYIIHGMHVVKRIIHRNFVTNSIINRKSIIGWINRYVRHKSGYKKIVAIEAWIFLFS